MKGEKVKYEKPSKGYWIKAFLLSIVNLSLFISLFKMFAFYWANCVVGRNKAKMARGPMSRLLLYSGNRN